MTLRQLEMLRAAAAGGSLSEGAKAVGLSQPAVSMQMKALAGELGVELFRSGSQGLELTSSGEALVEYAERILSLVEEGAAAARLGQRGASVVRLAASSTPGVSLLPGLLAVFRARAPGIVVRLQVINSEEVERRVLLGDADLGVVGGRRTLANLHAEPWCEDELVLVVPRDHRLARRRRVRPEELREETLLLREAGSATRGTIEAAFLRARAPLPSVHVVGSTEAIKNAVEAGLGIGILSRFSVAKERRSGDLGALRITGLELRRPLLLVTDPRRTLSEGAEQLLRYLRASRPGRAPPT